MKGKRKTGIRILAVLLAFALCISVMGTGSVSASEPPAVETEGESEPFTEEPESGPPAAESEEEVPMADMQQEPSGTEERETVTEKTSEETSEETTPEEEPAEDEDTEEKIVIKGEGEFINFALEQEAYLPGETVTAVLMPEPGYDVNLESIAVTDADGSAIEYQAEGPDENGTVTLTFQAAETDVTVKAEAEPWTCYSITVITETLEEGASVFEAAAEPAELWEGAEAAVSVNYTGSQIWAATVTYGEENADLDFSVSASSVAFTMPAADVTVVLSEREGQDMGDLSAEDGGITGDWQGNASSTKKEYEPDVELGKAARWTDIEDGYGELTITEKDTSDYANIPVDYIIILDRTRTMSLSGTTWEQGGYPDIVNENSPCINPNHYYYKGGLSLSLVDYYTGFERGSGIWFDNLPGGAGSWIRRHYNGSGQQIGVGYGNGCQDRLTMAKQAVYELMDRIASDNAGVPAGKIKSRVAFWSFADGTYHGGYDAYRREGCITIRRGRRITRR